MRYVNISSFSLGGYKYDMCWNIFISVVDPDPKLFAS